MSNSHGSSSTKKDVYPNFCACGDPIKYSTSKTDDNPGRRYKACPNWKDQQNPGCGYFRWLDKLTKEASNKIEKCTKEGSNNKAIHEGLLELVKLGRRGIRLMELVLVLMVVIAVLLALGLGLYGKKNVILALP